MSVLAKIGVFCAFLVTYSVWTFLTYKLGMRLINAMVAQRGYFVVTQALGFVVYIGVFTFVWLLSGFLDARFIGLLLAGQLLSFALTGVSWAMLGSPKINWGAYLCWESVQLVLRYPWSKWVDMAVGSIATLGFPVAAGWVYFTSDVPSDEATRRVFQVTIFALFLLGMIISAKGGILLLSSATMNEHARDRALVTQLGGFISSGLMFSMILWAFGVGAQGVTLGTEIPVTVSPSVVGVLIAFLLLVYVAPYMVGVQRSKILRRAYDQETEGILRDVVENLKLPRSSLARADGLAQLQDRIENRVSEIRSDSPQLNLADELEATKVSSGGLPKAIAPVKLAYEHAHVHDPCLQHVKYLKKLDTELNDLKTAFTQLDTDPSFKASLDDAKELFEARLERLSEGSKSKESPKMAVWIAAALSALASPILSELGKRIAARVTDVAASKSSAFEWLVGFLT